MSLSSGIIFTKKCYPQDPSRKDGVEDNIKGVSIFEKMYGYFGKCINFCEIFIEIQTYSTFAYYLTPTRRRG